MVQLGHGFPHVTVILEVPGMRKRPSAELIVLSSKKLEGRHWKIPSHRGGPKGGPPLG